MKGFNPLQMLSTVFVYLFVKLCIYLFYKPQRTISAHYIIWCHLSFQTKTILWSSHKTNKQRNKWI